MTNEEAINILEQIDVLSFRDTTQTFFMQDVIYAIDTAIDALKAQPCDDCISRVEVLRHKHLVLDYGGIGYSMVRVDEIIDLPSVTPQPKVGEWIVTGYDYKCINCEAEINGEINYMSKSKIKYCPYCGIKLEGE